MPEEKKITPPPGFRALRRGEVIKPTDMYIGLPTYSSENGRLVSACSWYKQWNEPYIYGISFPTEFKSEEEGPLSWAIVRLKPDVDEGWIPVTERVPVSGQRVLVFRPTADASLGHPRIKTTAWCPSLLLPKYPVTHWRSLASLGEPVPPDKEIALNSQHTVIVKGDKSGVLVGCSKNSFVPAAKIQEIADLLK